MREIFNDFMLVERLPDGQERVRISGKQVLATGLQEGDEITLVEYDNLRARAILQYEDGHWYGLIIGAIEDINLPETPAQI